MMTGRQAGWGIALVAALGIGLGIGAQVGPGRAGDPLPDGLWPDERATITLFQTARDSVVAIRTAAQVRDPFSLRRMTEPVGSGSGFVWDDQGHVVTNAHVIAGATAAQVQLADGRSFPARLVGLDRTHDLAVLRIEATDLPPPFAASPDAALVGQRVLAIGNPFGLDWTLTSGIVSALDRELEVARGQAIRGLIQTDAAINPGNSGGPLLDSQGRLMGVNTAIYSPSGASAGIGFAVPVATVARVVPQLIATGRYTPPALGVVWDARLNAAVNRQGLAGVMVLDVTPGTDAAAADLLPARLSRDGRIVPGDVIVALDGARIADLDDLLAALDSLSAGQEVTVTLSRDGVEREERLTLIPGG